MGCRTPSRWSHLGALRRHALAVGVACMLAVGVSSMARAQPAGDAGTEAKRHFEAGVTAYEVGDYQGALAEFQEAYRVKPHPLVRVNMANCYDRLNKPVEAIFHFEKFMAAPEGTPEQRKEVREALRRLRLKVGEVSIRVTPDGAVVQIDDEETRKAPILEAVLLKAGTHTIRASLDGYVSAERTFEVLGGQPTSVDITLERTEAAPALLEGILPPQEPAEQVSPAPEESVDVSAVAPLSEPPAEPGAPSEDAYSEGEAGGGRRLTTGVIIAGSVTLALAVAATVTGIVALGKSSDFDEAAAVVNDAGATVLERHEAYDRALSSADKAEAMALTTDLLLLGAVAGAAVTAVLWFNSGSSGERARVELQPSLARQGGGVVLSGAF